MNVLPVIIPAFIEKNPLCEISGAVKEVAFPDDLDEVTSKVARLGCRIYEVGISYSGRTYAEGEKIDWKDGMRAIWCILTYR